uniref:Uncharacterized protein n=1 Tax=Anguilla anguilla TaxID=7936 RepID=A0A0E9R0N4_ANGAN
MCGGNETFPMGHFAPSQMDVSFFFQSIFKGINHFLLAEEIWV